MTAQLREAAQELLSALDQAEEGADPPTFSPGYGNGQGVECGYRIAAARKSLAALSHPVSSPPNTLTATAPQRVWLQINPDGVGNGVYPYPADHDGVTWCWHSIGGDEVEYVRADLAAQPVSAPAAEQAEPVAWTWPGAMRRQFTDSKHLADLWRKDGLDVKELYTHAQPAREPMTRSECLSIAERYSTKNWTDDYLALIEAVIADVQSHHGITAQAGEKQA